MTVSEEDARFVTVDLGPWFNNKCAGFPEQRAIIDTTGLGNGFAAEELPPPGGVYWHEGVPFRVPDFRAAADNLLLEGASVAVPRGPCRALHFWGFADTSLIEARLVLVFAGGARRGAGLEFSSWTAVGPSCRGERLGARSCTVRTRGRDVSLVINSYVQTVAVEAEDDLVAIEFDDAPVVHILALTLGRPAGGEGGPGS